MVSTSLKKPQLQVGALSVTQILSKQARFFLAALVA